MIDRKTLRTVMMIICVTAFAVVSAFYLNKEKARCLGVEIIREEQLAKLGSQMERDLSGVIMFGGQKAATDTETATVYIPQNIKDNSLYTEFEKELASADESCSLYFVWDDSFKDMPKAVKDGHIFRLVAATAEGYTQYNVVFTSLPVMRVEGEVVGQNEDERDVYEGNLCLWSPKFKSTGAYNIKTSSARWHFRGNSNYHVGKKSLKLTLLDAEGLNSDLDLIGNEYEDDDWILNALYMDDTKLREKLVMDMWNTLCDSTPYNLKMSTGEYVEVVRDGRYQGLYLLENRVDGKYLELEEEQVLVKGQPGHDSTEISDHYRIIQSQYDEKLVWDRMEGLFNRDNGQYIQLDNWIDVSLFVQLGYMTDNSNRYNAFYLIDEIEENPSIKTILWDTDLALGIGWVDGVFTRSLEIGTTKQRYRKEDESLRKIYPDLDDMIAQRYKELRKSTFSEEYIFENIERLGAVIDSSGVMQRDEARWKTRCKGEDTREFLCQYIEARLEFLDGVYGIN